MIQKRLWVGSVVILGMLLVGTYLLVHSVFAQVERSNVLLNDSFTIQANDYQYRTTLIYSPAMPESAQYTASFTVSSGTIKFSPFTPGTYQLWQEGTYQPDWTEADHADYGMSIGSGTQADNFNMYFVFLNDASYDKEVHLQVARVWNETNYPGMILGIATIATGMSTGFITKSKNVLQIKKIHIGYLALTYITGVIMIPLFMMVTMGDLGYLLGQSWGISIIAPQIQGTILLESVPLAMLVYMWLQKSGGATYLKSWGIGKKLRLVGLLPFSGVMINIALLTIDALTLWNFSGTRMETQYGVTRIPNPLYYGLLGIACILILGGLAAFVGLWSVHRKKTTQLLHITK